MEKKNDKTFESNQKAVEDIMRFSKDNLLNICCFTCKILLGSEGSIKPTITHKCMHIKCSKKPCKEEDCPCGETETVENMDIRKEIKNITSLLDAGKIKNCKSCGSEITKVFPINIDNPKVCMKCEKAKEFERPDKIVKDLRTLNFNRRQQQIAEKLDETQKKINEINDHISSDKDEITTYFNDIQAEFKRIEDENIQKLENNFNKFKEENEEKIKRLREFKDGYLTPALEEFEQTKEFLLTNINFEKDHLENNVLCIEDALNAHVRTLQNYAKKLSCEPRKITYSANKTVEDKRTSILKESMEIIKKEKDFKEELKALFD